MDGREKLVNEFFVSLATEAIRNGGSENEAVEKLLKMIANYELEPALKIFIDDLMEVSTQAIAGAENVKQSIIEAEQKRVDELQVIKKGVKK